MFLLRLNDTVRNAMVCCLLLIGVQQLGAAAVIKAKAWLAPILIQRAWEQTLLLQGEKVKPWPWADTWPVARLSMPGLGVDRLVLAGDSGNALAFGPGHAGASAALGSSGLAVIGGHRDTHFAFLKTVRTGHRIRLELPSGEQRNYRVRATRIVDSSKELLPRKSGFEGLLLVTCYPFDALRSTGPLRYLVDAEPVRLLPESLSLGSQEVGYAL